MNDGLVELLVVSHWVYSCCSSYSSYFYSDVAGGAMMAKMMIMVGFVWTKHDKFGFESGAVLCLI